MSRTLYPQRKECVTCRAPFLFLIPIRRLYCSPACVPPEVAERIKASEQNHPGRDYSTYEDEVGNAPRCCWKWDKHRGTVPLGRAWKKRFFTRREALASLTRWSDHTVLVYRCDFCAYFHLGHLHEERTGTVLAR